MPSSQLDPGIQLRKAFPFLMNITSATIFFIRLLRNKEIKTLGESICLSNLNFCHNVIQIIRIFLKNPNAITYRDLKKSDFNTFLISHKEKRVIRWLWSLEKIKLSVSHLNSWHSMNYSFVTLLTLLGLGLIKINSVLANFNNPH